MRRTIRRLLCIPAALKSPQGSCRWAQLPRRTARSTACVRRSFKRVRPGPVRPMQVLGPAAPNYEPLVLLAGGWPTELPTATPGYGCAGRHGPHLKACFDLQNELLRSHACRQGRHDESTRAVPCTRLQLECARSSRGLSAWQVSPGLFPIVGRSALRSAETGPPWTGLPEGYHE